MAKKLGDIENAKRATANLRAVRSDKTVISMGNPNGARDMVKTKILEAMPLIIDSIIAKAQAGSYLHANFLFDFAGVSALEPEKDDGEVDSLAEFLLRQLDDSDPVNQPISVKSSSIDQKDHSEHTS